MGLRGNEKLPTGLGGGGRAERRGVGGHREKLGGGASGKKNGYMIFLMQ